MSAISPQGKYVLLRAHPARPYASGEFDFRPPSNYSSVGKTACVCLAKDANESQLSKYSNILYNFVS